MGLGLAVLRASHRSCALAGLAFLATGATSSAAAAACATAQGWLG